MRSHRWVLCGLLATAFAAPAGAQSATGGVAGSASGAGNYGFSGGANAGASVSGNGSNPGIGLGGASRGIGTSGAGTGAYSIQGNGLPAGASSLPSVGGATR